MRNYIYVRVKTRNRNAVFKLYFLSYQQTLMNVRGHHGRAVRGAWIRLEASGVPVLRAIETCLEYVKVGILYCSIFGFVFQGAGYTKDNAIFKLFKTSSFCFE